MKNPVQRGFLNRVRNTSKLGYAKRTHSILGISSCCKISRLLRQNFLQDRGDTVKPSIDGSFLTET